MKTMKLRQKLEMRGCPKLRHLSVFIILSLLSYSSFSFEHKVGNSRTPASAFDEEVLTVPVEIKSISQTLFAEDDFRKRNSLFASTFSEGAVSSLMSFSAL